MHEFKHGELKRGPGGKGGKVKGRKQAIAIALSEAGTSKYQSQSENNKDLARTKRKEARSATAQQEREGKSHVGARGQREKQPDYGRPQCGETHSTRTQVRAQPGPPQRRRNQGRTLSAGEETADSGQLENVQASA